ncbi:MAG TPA: hypothetical protein VK698_13825 [Kofleriaceae bacterium]|jgi:hypothetical protein|nr:hypothetical protein [Kofleriaceae bacterium]
MIKLMGALALVLSACSGPDADALSETELTWSLEPDCHQPDEVESGWIEEGLMLWTEHWGVNITEVDAPADDGSLFFALCPTLELPRPGYGGWAEMNEGQGRISFYTGPSERYFIATVAHEAGHLILHGDADDHLAEPERGIMSPGIDCGPDLCLWSEPDIAHIESFGLIYEP